VGGELTSGAPDVKEGIYFGEELGPDNPRVASRTPLHGPNLFPSELPELRGVVLRYMAELTRVGRVLVAGLASSLGLESEYFHRRYTADPFVLFRIFNYPPSTAEGPWGVAEHCDYGLLTILKQDDVGGLEIKSSSGWVPAPPIPGAFVCNIGDMLERMTGGLYRSTLHRVRSPTGRPRLSFPFFFDPAWAARIEPIRPGAPPALPSWDGVSIHEFGGTYGDYLLSKVRKVFPDLGRDVLEVS
jgi:isopenicillin N synthase-like dioxygenase